MLRLSACEAKPEFIKVCKKVSREFGIEAPVVLQNQKVNTTFTAGLFKPFIILPLGENEAIFASREVFIHEFAHIKRNDFLWNQLRHMSTIIFPIQPLLWILSHWIEETSDYVSDDYVTYFTKNYRSYAVKLSHIAELYLPIGSELRSGVGFISVESPLRRRIKRILDNSKILSLKTNTRFVLNISIICIATMLFAGFISVEGKSISKSNDENEEFNFNQVMQSSNKPTYGAIINNDSYNVKGFNSLPEVNPQHTHLNDKNGVISDTADKTVTSNAKFNSSDPSFLDEESIQTYNQILSTEVLPPVENVRTEIETEKADTIQNVSFNNILLTETSALKSSLYDDNQNEKSNPNISQHHGYNSLKDESLENITAQITESDMILDDDFYANEIDNFSTLDMGINLFAFRNDNNLPSTAKTVPVRFDKKNYLDNINFRKLDRISYNPVWSPDGKWIAFSSKTYNKNFYSNLLWIVPSEGGEPKLIFKLKSTLPFTANNGFGYDGVLSACFTPDSQEVTFSVLRFVRRDNEPNNINGNGFHVSIVAFPVIDIESININTLEHRVIVQDGNCPAWSHNGRYLAFIKHDRIFKVNPQLASRHNVPAIIDILTGEIRYLADNKISTYFYKKNETITSFFEPIFSPNEASTYFINTREGHSGKRFWDPIFSPDDTQIIVCGVDYDSSTNDGQTFSSELFMIPIQGGNPEQLTYSETTNNHQEIIIRPRFSQDEQNIIFEKRTLSSNEELINTGLLSYNTLTSETTELIESPNCLVSYAWSPDGTKYCYENKETIKAEDLFAWKPSEGKTQEIIRLYTCDLDINALLKKTSANDNTEKPSSFKLIGNYPNPFNPTTTINFSLPETGFVSLNIYNITGQKVRDLVSENMEPGDHSVLWDGRDEYGSMVSSGMYLSQLRMGNNVQIHKMTMVK
jgi:Tol biopolymer transport system component